MANNGQLLLNAHVRAMHQQGCAVGRGRENVWTKTAGAKMESLCFGEYVHGGKGR